MANAHPDAGPHQACEHVGAASAAVLVDGSAWRAGCGSAGGFGSGALLALPALLVAAVLLRRSRRGGRTP